MEIIRLDKNGQLVIPKVVREHMRVSTGTEFTVSVSGQRIVLEAMRRKSHRLHDWPGFKHTANKLSDKEAFAPVGLGRHA